MSSTAVDRKRPALPTSPFYAGVDHCHLAAVGARSECQAEDTLLALPRVRAVKGRFDFLSRGETPHIGADGPGTTRAYMAL